MRKVALEYPQYPALQSDTEVVANTFSTLMKHYGECHKGVNSANYMNDSEIDTVGKLKCELGLQ